MLQLKSPKFFLALGQILPLLCAGPISMLKSGDFLMKIQNGETLQKTKQFFKAPENFRFFVITYVITKITPIWFMTPIKPPI